ncbi:hypothetical protein FHQ18_02200 [Deferribacter autotrophicus]|uniref:Uncharacterized protein n=1 Tax=Deferribacter autotrophicus TaxID=500465 RepID=A0A5A8F524_9BACT|nr:hypothetical protein [Deferribacter autotrophicus]KAA0258780.1 hypothetical protein FHQ18_02200 [Deferribacter autotrophicus]
MDKQIKEARKKLIKKLLWDYNISPEDALDVLYKKKVQYLHLTFDKLVVRALERLSYYDLLFLFGKEGLKEVLSENILNQLRNNDLREKYERLRKILSGEPLSFSRWDIENRKKTQDTLLFNRWNRS